MDQVFLFAFNGELIAIERRKKIKQNRQEKTQENENALCKQLFPASSLPVRRGASVNFPAKN